PTILVSLSLSKGGGLGVRRVTERGARLLGLTRRRSSGGRRVRMRAVRRWCSRWWSRGRAGGGGVDAFDARVERGGEPAVEQRVVRAAVDDGVDAGRDLRDDLGDGVSS